MPIVTPPLAFACRGWPLALVASISAHCAALALAVNWLAGLSPGTADTDARRATRIVVQLRPDRGQTAAVSDAAVAAPDRVPNQAARTARQSRASTMAASPAELAPPVLTVHREAELARAALPEGAGASATPAPQTDAVAPARAQPDTAERRDVALAADHGNGTQHTDVAYLHTPRPAYPALARSLGIEGTVKLRVLVNKEGQPEQARVLTSSGTEALDLAALEGVKTWRFAPAREGERPISHWVDIPVTFRLANR